MKKIFVLFTILNLLSACKSKENKIKPIKQAISESLYASGSIKSKNQYQVFSTVNGIVEKVFVEEGDTVSVGSPIVSISNEAQQLSKSNAQLSANYLSALNNQDKLLDAQHQVELAMLKQKNDSLLYFRQKALWQQQIGSKLELEQKELAYQNARTALASALVKRKDLAKQLEFTSAQANTNFQISSKLEQDYTLKSELNGIVYSLSKVKGELVTTQSPVAIIGEINKFILEMQVDEYDILKIKMNQQVIVSLDSYTGQVFQAKVSKINPYMNERSKTFTVEAEFLIAPTTLYPNVNFEANIVVHKKSNALLIPRNFLLNDSMVVKANGEKQVVKTGLKDYQMVEILSGLTEMDELIQPTE